MTVRFDPFRDMDRMLSQVAQAWAAPTTPAARGAGVPVDIVRSPDRYVARMDLPGVDPASIEVTVDKDVLTVSATRDWQPGEDERLLVAERPQGRFARQLHLGDGVAADRVEAAYDRGVLTLTIPVAESATPRRIEVTVADGSGADRAVEAGSRTT